MKMAWELEFGGYRWYDVMQQRRNELEDDSYSSVLSVESARECCDRVVACAEWSGRYR